MSRGWYQFSVRITAKPYPARCLQIRFQKSGMPSIRQLNRSCILQQSQAANLDCNSRNLMIRRRHVQCEVPFNRELTVAVTLLFGRYHSSIVFNGFLRFSIHRYGIEAS
jgi:hypothetical protein